MADFKIEVPEVRWAIYYVEADSKEEAIAKYKDGDAEYEGDAESIETLGPTIDHPWYINSEEHNGQ